MDRKKKGYLCLRVVLSGMWENPHTEILELMNESGCRIQAKHTT